MQFAMRARLSALFFGQYFAIGSWMVSLGTYMSKSLGFDAIIAETYSMVGFATIAATLFVGVIADRFFDATKVLATMSICASASLFWMSTITHAPNVFILAMFVHCIFYISSIPLLATIAFNTLSDPGQQYPSIRVFGSIGWVVAGLVIGMIQGAAQTKLPMYSGAVTYAIMAFYALTLPKTPPRALGQKISFLGLFGFDVLKQVKDKSFWIFIACVLFVVIPKKFYDSYANNFFVEKGLAINFGNIVFEPTAIQTLGQIAEAGTMLLIPFLIARIGIKWVMVLGMIGWISRFVLFAYGFNGSHAIVPMLIAGIMMHGLSYDFFFVSGQIYMDRLFKPEMRARVQAFYWFILSGIGVVIGALIAGKVYRFFTISQKIHDWTSIWLAPCLTTLIVCLLFTWKFHEPKSEPTGVREFQK